MRISLIVAMAENRIIGRANGLPWRISADLKHFKAITTGKAVIMGRKTYESIGRPLPDRHNIVVSRDLDFEPDCVEVARSLKAALHAAEGWGDDEAMVIGGAAIYEQALAQADRLYLTEVHAEVQGDVSFPEFDPCQWRELSRERHSAGQGADHDYSFVVLERGIAFDVDGLDAGPRARAYFADGGYYCAEAVLKSLMETSDRVETVPVRVASGFCSGLARTSSLCGALSGGILALNLALGRDEPGRPIERNYAAIRDLMALFEARFGATQCGVLTGVDLDTEDGRQAFAAKGQKESCRDYAAVVAEWVETRLRET
ncbi:dihydrofolate reductase [Magnetospira sp. QH-2]|uniref:dihydrofolate reductase n=1 Tax=Magnetospira sp. (strain QH-2) TaxID=1288970 RepID=UPI0003E80A82|nr:dihydrofolate reductase [Magnetospira sp. QH-2]CCQ73478.1 Conserved protein of unknown function. Containing dihydrofolate reductase (modular protein) domain [Magnetospira sp. QH-2]